jgi:SAM-dependent methyltransferase
MATVKEHYDDLLGSWYTWMFGDYQTKVEKAEEFFASREIRPLRSGLALDLGSGPGYNAVALARMGFEVTAVDFCPTLLDELAGHAAGLPVTAVEADFVDYLSSPPGPIEVCVCMGDTLPHLEDPERVQTFIERVYAALAPLGLFVITYRDLSFELQGTGRFIPIRSDDSTIFTCFLEFAEDRVMVHDLLHMRNGNHWDLKKSCYPKLRLPADFLLEQLERSAFIIEECQSIGGMITIVAARGA